MASYVEFFEPRGCTRNGLKILVVDRHERGVTEYFQLAKSAEVYAAGREWVHIGLILRIFYLCSREIYSEQLQRPERSPIAEKQLPPFFCAKVSQSCPG